MPKKSTRKRWPIELGIPQRRRRRKKRRRRIKQFPPPVKPTKKTLRSLIDRYGVHKNPDPPPCPHCGMRYSDFKTGLDYQSVYNMLWSGSPDPDDWRYKGRHSVLGLWYQIKRGMWSDHKHICGDREAQADWMAETDLDYRPVGYEEKLSWEEEPPF